MADDVRVSTYDIYNCPAYGKCGCVAECKSPSPAAPAEGNTVPCVVVPKQLFDAVTDHLSNYLASVAEHHMAKQLRQCERKGESAAALTQEGKP